MIKKNLFNKILKLVSILSIALTLSLMTFSFTAFAFTVAPSSQPKPIVITNYDIKGKATAGLTIRLTFDSGEIFTGVVGADGKYSININYPHIKGIIQIEELNGTVVEDTFEYDYDITKFNTDSKGNIIGPVIFSGVGEVPGTTINITFPSGETVAALVDSTGKFSASPTFPSPSGQATSTGDVPSAAYEGGITSVAATQVTPPDPTPKPTPTPTPAPSPTPAPDPGIKPVATAASTAAKATVRSGGFLQIAGIIALFTVILAILIINKKFKR
jgi:hypothetical protein